MVLSNVYFSSSASCDLWLIANMCNLFMNMLGLQEGFPYSTVFTIESGRHLQMQMQMESMVAMRRKRVRVRVNPS